jgi:predicted nucleic acid-binding protein
MSAETSFIDTNVLLYLLSEDSSKADVAEGLLRQGGVISVQVLSEFTSVCSRKLKMSYSDIRDMVTTIKMVLSVRDLTPTMHEGALDIAEHYGYSFYDSMILAAAVSAGCNCVYTEELHAGQKIKDQVFIVNPFGV